MRSFVAPRAGRTVSKEDKSNSFVLYFYASLTLELLVVWANSTTEENAEAMSTAKHMRTPIYFLFL
jgi:hypothetical protein